MKFKAHAVNKILLGGKQAYTNFLSKYYKFLYPANKK